MVPPNTHRPMLAQRDPHTHTHMCTSHRIPHTRSPRYVHTRGLLRPGQGPTASACAMCVCPCMCVLVCEYVPVCATVCVCCPCVSAPWAKEEREGKRSSGSSV